MATRARILLGLRPVNATPYDPLEYGFVTQDPTNYTQWPIDTIVTVEPRNSSCQTLYGDPHGGDGGCGPWRQVCDLERSRDISRGSHNIAASQPAVEIASLLR